MSVSFWMRLPAMIFFAISLGLGKPALASQETPADAPPAHQAAEEQHPPGESSGKETGKHGYAGPHGGFWADAGGQYHFEVRLEQSGLLKMWLYGGEAKPLPVTDIPARWVLAPGNTYPLKGNFNTFEDGNYYWVQFPPHESEAIHIKVEAMKDGKWAGVEYYLPVGKAAEPAPAQSETSDS